MVALQFSLFIPLVEVMIITVMINYILSFFWNTRSLDLILGLIAFFFIFIASSFLHLPVLQKIMSMVGNVAFLGFLILFQPELRTALSKLSIKGKKTREISEFDEFLENLTHSTFKLAERSTGALIVLENEDTLEEYSKRAIPVHAIFTSELLESIFTTTTPLHDGAVVISGTTIVSASTILPLAEDTPFITKSMGTRHRAALGLSQVSDAVIIVVSEESGKVSIARDGIITRGIKIDRFKGVIKTVFSDKNSQSRGTPQKWWEFVKR